MEDSKFRRYQASTGEREALIERLTELLSSKSEVLLAFLYGSFLEGGTFRDIDIGIFVNKERVTTEEHLDYELSLLEELSGAISYPSDRYLQPHRGQERW